MKFKPFKMAEFSAQWPAGSLQNYHSSNPQPLSWDELAAITGIEVTQIISNSPLAYESIQGRPKLRRLLCEHHYPKLHSNDVVLTSGAQEGIFLVMHALLEPGDEVVTFSPCFEPLVAVAEELGAQVTALPLQADKAWAIDWPALEQALKPTTKLLVINFPHNPTGCHISETELKQLVTLCEKHRCWLFSDEVFRGLEHQSEQRIAPAATLYDHAISMGVMSKALGLPGIRLGWLVTQNQTLIQRLSAIKSHLSICQSSLDAQLSESIIPHSEAIWQRNVDIIKDNKATISKWLNEHPKLHWQPPSASATGLVQLEAQSGETYAYNMARNHDLLLLPNKAFLTTVQGFRLSLGLSFEGLSYDWLKLN